MEKLKEQIELQSEIIKRMLERSGNMLLMMRRDFKHNVRMRFYQNIINLILFFMIIMLLVFR